MRARGSSRGRFADLISGWCAGEGLLPCRLSLNSDSYSDFFSGVNKITQWPFVDGVNNNSTPGAASHALLGMIFAIDVQLLAKLEDPVELQSLKWLYKAQIFFFFFKQNF